MKKRHICAVALCLTTRVWAQSAALPQTYSFLSTNSLVGSDMTVKVNRNGPKELIERTAVPKPGNPNPFHDRVLYDFQAHRIYSLDLNSHLCTTQAYTSAYAPLEIDPIGGAAETRSQLAANPSKALGTENVNGIRAKVVEITSPEMREKIWLDEQFSFMVKLALGAAGAPETAGFEMRQLSYAPSPAALFTTPSGCTQVGGAVTASGGHAELTTEVKVPAQTHQLGGPDTPAGNQPVEAGGVDPLMGKWDFTGRDSAGVAWRGTLTVGALDPQRFDPNPAKYNHMCELELQSASSGRGREVTCLYDPRTRTLSFSGGAFSNKYSYTAVLSPDGKSLMQGRWAEGNSGSGTWSARSTAAAPEVGGNAGQPASPAGIVPRSNALAKVTAVNLKAIEVPYDGPCGKKLQVSGSVTTDGPATVWYRFYANVGGVDFSEGQNGTVNLTTAGTASIGKDATFSQNKSGELRIQAAAQNSDGRHGGVTISNVVPFQVACAR